MVKRKENNKINDIYIMQSFPFNKTIVDKPYYETK